MFDWRRLLYEWKRKLWSIIMVIALACGLILGRGVVPPPVWQPQTPAVGNITYYMRSDTHTVNGLSAYVLNETQSSSSQFSGPSKDGTGYTCYYAVRVWIRYADGTEHELTDGTYNLQVSRTSDGEGLQSINWTCPETSLNATDALVIRIYSRVDSDAWSLGNPAKEFITVQLGGNKLSSTQWTFYLYTKRSTSGNQFIGYSTDAVVYWGTSTYNTHVEGIAFTSTTPPTYNNLGSSGSSEVGGEREFHCHWSGTNLTYWIFSWNASGVWTNSTYHSFTNNTSDWSNITMTLNYYPNTVVGWRFYANDSYGWSASPVNTFNITLSENDVAWKTLNGYWANVSLISAENLNCSFGGWQTFDITPTYGRYLRLDNMTSSSDCFDIHEIQVNVSGSFITPTGIIDVSNDTSSWPASNVIDGDVSTFWRCYHNGKGYIIFDLGIDYNVYQIKIYSTGGASAEAKTIDVSVTPWVWNGTAPLFSYKDNSYIWSNRTDYNPTFTFDNWTTNNPIIRVDVETRYNITGSTANMTLKVWSDQLNEWNNYTLQATNGEWNDTTITLSNIGYSVWDLNHTIVKFEPSGTATFTIDYLVLNVKYGNYSSVSHVLEETSISCKEGYTYHNGTIHITMLAYIGAETYNYSYWYYVTVYDVAHLQWVGTFRVELANHSDAHWNPMITVSFDGHPTLFYGYYQPLYYKKTVYSLYTETNLTKVFSNWQPHHKVPVSAGTTCYPEPLRYNDELIVFTRTGTSAWGNLTMYRWNSTGWYRYKIFYPPPQPAGSGSYSSNYWRIKQYGDTILIVYYWHYGVDIDNISNRDVFLTYSPDRGETWYHWNGTQLSKPFNSSVCLLHQIEHIAGFTVAKSPSGKVIVGFSNQTSPNYKSPLHNFSCYMITFQTFPSTSFTVSKMTDTNGNDVKTFRQIKFVWDDTRKRFTAWINVPKEEINSYIAKYEVLTDNGICRLLGSINNLISTYSNKDFWVIRDATAPYEIASGIKYLVIGNPTSGSSHVTENHASIGSLNSKIYAFRFKATVTSNVTGITYRVNATNRHSPFRVLLFNETGHLLAYGTRGEILTGSTTWIDDWCPSDPLSQKVTIQAGQYYWLGLQFIGNNQYNENTTIYYTVDLNYKACHWSKSGTNAPGQIPWSSVTNETWKGSLAATVMDLTILGFWDKLECLTYGVNVTNPDVNTTVQFFSEWVDYRGISEVDFWHNKTGTWQKVAVYDGSTVWNNVTMYLNVSRGTVIAWKYNATNTLGETASISTQYLLVGVTHLEVGWNNFTAWARDVGHTLGEVNASLNLEGINWTDIVLEFPNGTQVAFHYGFTVNANVTVTSTEDTFYIWVNVEDDWHHYYP